MSNLDDWLKRAEEEAMNAPGGGGAPFWKPPEGIYKVLVGEPEFRDQRFKRKNGTEEEVRMADFPILLVDGDEVKTEATWSIRVRKSERSLYMKVLNALKAARKNNDIAEVDGKELLAIVVEVKGEGLNREWQVESVSDYKKKFEQVANF